MFVVGKPAARVLLCKTPNWILWLWWGHKLKPIKREYAKENVYQLTYLCKRNTSVYVVHKYKKITTLISVRLAWKICTQQKHTWRHLANTCWIIIRFRHKEMINAGEVNGHFIFTHHKREIERGFKCDTGKTNSLAVSTILSAALQKTSEQCRED